LTYLLLLDTINHSILLERLSSWFGISSTAISWIKSYLLNRCFYVSIENSKSSVFKLLYGVSQGSILGPLFFILYTTPLSTIMCNLSANHQLYADDTRLLLSFSALDFSHNIPHLENTITNVANWMSSNFLFLNPSKTEFLIFSLPQQLSFISIILPFYQSYHSTNPTNLPNNVILILLVILVSSLIKICHLHNISLLFLNHASSICVT